MAIGACRAIGDLGRSVGRDILVAGFDDIPIARYLYGGPPPSARTSTAWADIAGQAVYDKIEGTAKAHLNDMMYELVVRGSTRPDN